MPGWQQLPALPGGEQPTVARALCLFCAADLALGQGDHVAQRYAEESLALWQRFRDDRQMAASLNLWSGPGGGKGGH